MFRLALPILLTGLALESSLAAPPSTASWTLTNGIRVVSVYFPHSTNVSIFTYLPMGLASDGWKQTQWSHLVEHLVIRSTIPADSSLANAETLPDHMRLDFYGTTASWKDGLSHHQLWLSGLPFTGQGLEAEKPKVKAEGDYTVRNYYTHKFALAAWAQGVRHGRREALIRGDIDHASLQDIQVYRNEHLAVLTNAVVCVVGGVEPGQVRAAASAQLAALTSKADLATPVQLHPGRQAMTWDLDARHVVVSWRIPAADTVDYAALFTAANWLNAQFASDATLRKITGMSLAGTDLRTPEGDFFYLSASLRPDGSFAEAEKAMEKYLEDLKGPGTDLAWVQVFGAQEAQSLQSIPDPDAFKNQLPPNLTLAMVEGNLGLQWGMNEFRFGSRKPTLIKNLSRLTPNQVLEAVKRQLSPTAFSMITLEPAAHH